MLYLSCTWGSKCAEEEIVLKLLGKKKQSTWLESKFIHLSAEQHFSAIWYISSVLRFCVLVTSLIVLILLCVSYSLVSLWSWDFLVLGT